jgi:hypothetical protein
MVVFNLFCLFSFFFVRGLPATDDNPEREAVEERRKKTMMTHIGLESLTNPG